MVRLTRIYTRTGDGGQTRLADMSVAGKTDPRVEAYGDVDETNSVLGVALAPGDLPTDVARPAPDPERAVRPGGRPVQAAPAAEPERPSCG